MDVIHLCYVENMVEIVKQRNSDICYPNINLRGGVIQVEANFFDLNAELKAIFNQQKQI